MDSAGGLMALGAGVVIVVLAIALLFIVSLWKIFTKAGQPGWAAIIPVYNMYVFTQVIRRPKWWILLYLGIYAVYYIGLGMIMNGNSSGGILTMLGGLAILVILIMDYHRLSTSFGQGAGFTVGLVLLGFIFFPLLAFGSYTYTGGTADSSGGLLDKNI